MSAPRFADVQAGAFYFPLEIVLRRGANPKEVCEGHGRIDSVVMPPGGNFVSGCAAIAYALARALIDFRYSINISRDALLRLC